MSIRDQANVNRGELQKVDDSNYNSINPSLVNSTIKLSEHLKPITRKYLISFESSLNDLAAEPDRATWTPDNGSHHIFQSRTRYSSEAGAQRMDTPQGNLKNVLLIGMKIKKVHSNFPCELGVKVSGAKGNYYLANGERYAYTMFPGENNGNLDEIVVTTNPYVNSEYLRAFPGFTGDKLSNNIIDVPGENFKYVDCQHPIIEMLKENSETLQLDISPDDLVDERFYKVSSSVVDGCIDRLKNELQENLPLIDLSKFNVSIQRPYETSWDDVNGPCDNVSNEQKRDAIMNASRRCSFVLEMTYSFA